MKLKEKIRDDLLMYQEMALELRKEYDTLTTKSLMELAILEAKIRVLREINELCAQRGRY